MKTCFGVNPFILWHEIVQSYKVYNVQHVQCSNPTVAARCMDERRQVMSRLEAKIESGIEK